MKIVYFTHSLVSCWNHGNAHFLRGVLDELRRRGHDTIAFEPETGWSRQNLLRDHGPSGLAPFQVKYPDLQTYCYSEADDLARMTDGADLVIVHEWNEPDLVAGLGMQRKRGAPFLLLFHDTHHRAVSAPEEMRTYDLSGYDGVLAFGEALSEVYRAWGWGSRVWTWHEAADVRRFRPPDHEQEREGLVWIGNWGDGERSEELTEFLLAPARAAHLDLAIYGVRYPDDAVRTVARYGAHLRGWAPNPLAPEIFARHAATLHVPRRYYAKVLPGIPTIRVFEALACGIPLVCAPWEDAEQLFRPGADYLIAENGRQMSAHLRTLAQDADMRAELAESGLATIHAQHTCAHRADELLTIVGELSQPDGLRKTA
ncbi:CgeB family protein [Pelagerythrobacter rhizovicinus]|uniref:Glycosyltransferase n=1 Tax=Pelagerythrobacter rhizovicinus TaxID=2268576 RepID=A0A4Q2KJL9_9SPHN|nr:glycosyltransferase [Pelagerythrobacter rhizovicinus]RXZ65424.1 glycosyltransferase [Pelagerythrobacter rhizovicinus]